MSQYDDDIDPITKLSPYGAAFIFVLTLGNHHGFVGVIQEFIALAVVIKFIHYVALRSYKISEFIMAQVAIDAFYFFIFHSFFHTTTIFLMLYDAFFAFYIYSHFQEFRDATFEGAFMRFKKALLGYGFKK